MTFEVLEMKEEIFYMVGIIGVGFLVNYSLRALPFLLFSGRNRELPPWVDRLGKVISPIIIGCLIVYSYSGSACERHGRTSRAS